MGWNMGPKLYLPGNRIIPIWRAGGYLLQICQLCLDVGHGGSPLFSFLAFFPEQRLAKSVAVRIEIDILWWGISQTESKERTPKFTDNNHHFPSFSSPHKRPQGRAILNQLQMYALSRNVPVDNWRLGCMVSRFNSLALNFWMFTCLEPIFGAQEKVETIRPTSSAWSAFIW